ncbi:hypothetical protein J6590_061585 [Homalodisca vitripennis]|nr:hypothetical protein J6590_061585 [Homalodisca vitripennis]
MLPPRLLPAARRLNQNTAEGDNVGHIDLCLLYTPRRSVDFAVNRLVRRVCPMVTILKPKWNDRALPALLACIHLEQGWIKNVFFLLLIPLERIGLYGALPDVRSGGGPVY